MLRLRKGKHYEGVVVRAVHPKHGVTTYFAVKKNGEPNLRRPLRWVVDHYEHV